MSYALKGVDATLFMIFQALGRTVTVRPVLGDEAFESWNEYPQERWYKENEAADKNDSEAQDEPIRRVGDKFHGLVGKDEQDEEGGDHKEVSSAHLAEQEELFLIEVHRYWILLAV